jgi:UDP-N-acetyl-D-mannosaminuronic acid dehydrogenase
MLINEGLPKFLVAQLEQKMGTLAGKKIGILGMAFKANCDDTRDSLSYKIKKELEMRLAEPLMTDVYDSILPEAESVLKVADGVILATPHREYLDLRPHQPFVDCWGIWRERKEVETK